MTTRAHTNVREKEGLYYCREVKSNYPDKVGLHHGEKNVQHKNNDQKG